MHISVRNFYLVQTFSQFLIIIDNNQIYNKDAIEGTEDYLNKNDFNNIFGKYYMKIDRIISSRNTNQKSSFLSSLFFDLSLASLFILGLKLMFEKRQTQTNN